MKLEFISAPHEQVKSMRRLRLYEMSDEQREQLKQVIWEVVQEAFKKIERDTGQTVYELAVQDIADRVESGKVSLEVVKDLLSRIPNALGRAELLRHLRARFPNETWDQEPATFKKTRNTTALHQALWDEEEKVEKHLAELRAKIESGTATCLDRLEEFLVATELDASYAPYHDPAGQHLRQQEIEAMLYILDMLVRPIRVKGKAMVRAEPHELHERYSLMHDGGGIQPGELGALLDIASF